MADQRDARAIPPACTLHRRGRSLGQIIPPTQHLRLQGTHVCHVYLVGLMHAGYNILSRSTARSS